MYNKERSEKRRLYVASLKDDMPVVLRGGLIPKRVLYTAPDMSVRRAGVWYLRPAILMTLSVMLFAVSLGTTAYSVLRGNSSSASAIVASEPIGFDPDPFNYGLSFEQENEDVSDAVTELITTGSNFVEVDILNGEVRMYASGTVTTTLTIINHPKSDSWWYVPTGVYGVNNTYQKMYSAFSNIYLPWSVQFSENFYIHGTPFYPDGEEVPPQYAGGGIRLSDADAELLFGLVTDDMPVLVRGDQTAQDSFVYESRAADVHARQYLVADLKSSTVLAADGLNTEVPIASLTKLMTALVAAEEIDLDRSVPIYENGDSIVHSLIPRLESGNSASMYSLLQLLLVESSNEAAEVIAGVLGRETFMRLMNEKATALGLSKSNFADPSGLSSENTSSVADLFRLTQYIFENRGFILELTADQNLPTAYTNGQFGPLVNFNYIDGADFIAGKVGETEAAGQTSISLHQMIIKGESRVVAVIVLGTDTRTADVTALLQFVADRFGD